MSIGMRLCILDPGLQDHAGHNFSFANLVALEARQRGIETLAWCNQTFAPDPSLPFTAVPTFRTSYYHEIDLDPITGDWSAFQVLNARLLDELKGLPAGTFGPDDLLLVQTITERHLQGLLRWLASFDAARAPQVVIVLMMSPGVELLSGRVRVYDQLKALFYRLLLGNAANLPPNVHLLATGTRFSRDYSYLAQRPVAAHPLLVDVSGDVAPPQPRSLLLFTGEALKRKGLALLPEVVERLSQALPGWRLIVHANDEPEWSAKAEVSELRRLSKSIPALDLRTGYLSAPELRELFQKAAAVVLPYDQKAYRNTTSGVLWEAVAAGRPIILPSDTSLENEASEHGASYAAISTSTAEALAAGIMAALPALDPEKSRGAAARFRTTHGVDRFLNYILSLRSP